MTEIIRNAAHAQEIAARIAQDAADSWEQRALAAEAALKQIADWKPREFTFPADWHEQIAACEECQRYSGHPIQKGICGDHRRPLWDREAHDRDQCELRGLYARNIAIAALEVARKAGFSS